MEGISFVMVVGRSYIIPLVRFSNLYGFWVGGFFRRRHSLELPDIIYQLQVINISFITPSLVGLDVPASFPVKLIHEGEGVASPAMFGKPLTCDKLVPSRDKYQLWVDF